MIPMMSMATAVASTHVARMAQRPMLNARRATGLAIVASGWAMLVAQALQHMLGGLPVR